MTEKTDTERQAVLEVAIEGEGLSPHDIPIRQLVELLEGAASALEALAIERGIDVPKPRLVEVRNGSAAYELEVPSPQAEWLIGELYEAAKTRGRNARPELRHALNRLHGAGRGVGSVRLSGATARRKLAPIRLAPLVAVEPYSIIEGTVVEARVSGVIAGQMMKVHLRMREGGTVAFVSEPSIAEHAARLFNRPVRAHVTFTSDVDGRRALGIDELEPWPEGDAMEVIDTVRSAFAHDRVNPLEWIVEENEDDDGPAPREPDEVH